MMLTGHKTRAVFERYNIVNEKDLRDGVSKLAAFFDQHPPAPVQPEGLPLAEGAQEKPGVGDGNLIPFPVTKATGKRKGKATPVLAKVKLQWR